LYPPPPSAQHLALFHIYIRHIYQKRFLGRSRWRQRQLLNRPRTIYPIWLFGPFLLPFSPPKSGASPANLPDTPLLQYHKIGIRAQSRYGRHCHICNVTIYNTNRNQHVGRPGAVWGASKKRGEKPQSDGRVLNPNIHT
jgi:hypothetical protein